MPSENKTPNLGLNQWQGNEYVRREDFVQDNKIIDETIEAIDTKVKNLIHDVQENSYTDPQTTETGIMSFEGNERGTFLAEIEGRTGFFNMIDVDPKTPQWKFNTKWAGEDLRNTTEGLYFKNNPNPTYPSSVAYVYANLNSNDIYYFSAIIKSNQANCVKTAVGNANASRFNEKVNEWERLSSRGKKFNINEASVLINNPENPEEVREVTIKHVVLINLTQEFGSGNEPSQEWCDENIEFKDGLPYVRGIKLINSNKFVDFNTFFQHTTAEIVVLNGVKAWHLKGDVNQFYRKILFDKFKTSTQYTIRYSSAHAVIDKRSIFFTVEYTDGDRYDLFIPPKNVEEFNTITYTSKPDKTIEKIFINYGDGVESWFAIDDFALQEGTEIIEDDEEFKCSSVYINEPLYSIRDIKDYVRNFRVVDGEIKLMDHWELERNIERVELWEYEASGITALENTYRFKFVDNTPVYINNSRYEWGILHDNNGVFKNIYDYNEDVQSYYIEKNPNVNSAVWVKVNKSIIDAQEGPDIDQKVDNWKKNNKLTLYYVMRRPIIKKLNIPLLSIGKDSIFYIEEWGDYTTIGNENVDVSGEETVTAVVNYDSLYGTDKTTIDVCGWEQMADVGKMNNKEYNHGKYFMGKYGIGFVFKYDKPEVIRSEFAGIPIKYKILPEYSLIPKITYSIPISVRSQIEGNTTNIQNTNRMLECLMDFTKDNKNKIHNVIRNGIIVESDENNSGEYIRFSNGIQVCTHVITVDVVANEVKHVVWKLPVEFKSPTKARGFISLSSVSKTFNYNLSFLSIGVNWQNLQQREVRILADVSQSYTVDLMIIGRWK